MWVIYLITIAVNFSPLAMTSKKKTQIFAADDFNDFWKAMFSGNIVS